jgi:hypothetical protein
MTSSGLEPMTFRFVAELHTYRYVYKRRYVFFVWDIVTLLASITICTTVKTSMNKEH